MSDNQPDDLPDLEALLQRIGPNPSPEDIQAALGGVDMLGMLNQMREQASEMLQELGGSEEFPAGDDSLPVDAPATSPPAFDRPDTPDGDWKDYPGAETLWEAAAKLPPSERLEISIEVKATPVTDVEQAIYQQLHYRLLFDVHGAHVTYQDVNSPRQDYLHGKRFPAMVTRPREMWPDAAPQWETLQVYRYDLSKALTSNSFPRHRLEELESAAAELLRPHFG